MCFRQRVPTIKGEHHKRQTILITGLKTKQAMKVLLISPNTENTAMPVYPAGMHLVAQAARQSGHEAATLDMFEHPDPWQSLDQAVQGHAPDVVGLSVRNIDDQTMENPRFFLEETRNVVRRLREITRATLVVGGAGYSIYPLSGLEYLEADMGLAGEGEIALPALLQALEGQNAYDSAPGLYLPQLGQVGPQQLVRDLDSCPLAGHEWIPEEFMNRDDFWMPFQTRRGCPLNCSYCSTSSIEGRHIRKRSVSRVVDSLKDLQDAGVGRVFFVDNTFNLPGGYARDLCQGMIREGLDLSWCSIIYPMGVDQELAEVMARAGCRHVSLGFESGSPLMLSALNKRFSLVDVRQASDHLARAGIKRAGFLLLGGPGETQDTVRQSLDFAESLELDALKITVGIRIYPHTRLARQAVDSGMVDPGDSLLRPCFYLEPGLSDWLPAHIAGWASQRPGLIL